MEKKDADQYSAQSKTNNSVNNYGVNHGNMAHSITITGPKPQGDDLSPNSVETGIWKEGAVKLVGESRTEEALAEILKSMPPEDIKMQVILLAGRISQLKIQEIAGIIDKETELRELNNIRNGILTLISRC